MKRILFLLVFFLSALTCYSQDIVTFVNGKSLKAKVLEVTQAEIKYRLFDNLEGPLYTKSKEEVFSITYSNGTSERFYMDMLASNKTVNQLYTMTPIDPKLENRLRRLKVWSAICRIFGGVELGFCTFIGIMDDRGSIGVMLCGLEGFVTLGIGYGLDAKRERLMKKNHLAGSVPVLQKEFKFDNYTIAPSVDMLSYRNNPLDGVGAGVKISF